MEAVAPIWPFATAFSPWRMSGSRGRRTKMPFPGFAIPSNVSGMNPAAISLPWPSVLPLAALAGADLPLTSEDKARAMALQPGLDPSEWSIDQAARIAFMVASYAEDDAAFAAAFDGFCATAGLNELIALCRGLPVYPAAALLEPSAGSRSVRHEARLRGRSPSAIPIRSNASPRTPGIRWW